MVGNQEIADTSRDNSLKMNFICKSIRAKFGLVPQLQSDELASWLCDANRRVVLLVSFSPGFLYTVAKHVKNSPNPWMFINGTFYIDEV